MEKLEFEFKVKVKPDGSFNRPDLSTKNYIGEAVNDTQLKIKYRKRKKESGSSTPPKTMNINNLPENVAVYEKGFLTGIRVTI